MTRAKALRFVTDVECVYDVYEIPDYRLICLGQGDDDENGTVAAMAELQLKSGLPDLLTLEELALHLATARAKYHKNTNV